MNRHIHQAAALAALLTAGCTIDAREKVADLVTSDAIEDRFVLADAERADLPEGYILIAPPEKRAVARRACGALIARLERDCTVVNGEGARLDLQRAAASRQHLAVATEAAIEPYPNLALARWRDNEAFVFLTAGRADLEDVASDVALRIGAEAAAEVFFEAFIAAIGQNVADRPFLIAIEERTLGPLCDATIEIAALRVNPVFLEEETVGEGCPITVLDMPADMIAALVANNPNWGALVFPLSAVRLFGERPKTDPRLVTETLDVAFNADAPAAAALRRALGTPYFGKPDAEARARALSRGRAAVEQLDR